MPTDATGTPTALGIPKFNTNVDAPSGLGFNAAMDTIDALIDGRMEAPSSPASGDVPVWNGSAWVKSSTTKMSEAGIDPGAEGDILTTVGGASAWAPPSGGDFRGISVYRNAAYSPANGWAAFVFDTEDLDPDSAYDTANGRFTPTVAGKWLITAHVMWADSFNAVAMNLAIYKNGSEHKRLAFDNEMSTETSLGGAGIVTANGTTDYFQIYTYNGDIARAVQVGGRYCYFDATYLGA